jgi:mRNA-degrading endonuclease RelE of RelBE toxin-antitoxin system
LKSRYLIKSHRLVEDQDLRELTPDILEIFEDIRQSVLIADPYRCLGLPNHSLRGELANYRAVEIDWNGVAYRLVYRIYETPAPKRVVILSFAEHDPAYDRALERKPR